MPQTAFDPVQFRAACGRFATGVTIVTCHGSGGVPAGFTASSFSSVSLDPPIVSVCLADTAQSLVAFEAAERFAISILNAGHHDTAMAFARKAEDKFATADFTHTRGAAPSAPYLPDAAAVFHCRVHDRPRIGDHVVLFGLVEAVDIAADAAEPLVYYDKAFRAFM